MPHNASESCGGFDCEARPAVALTASGQDKLHEALTLRLEQQADVMDLRALVAADLRRKALLFIQVSQKSSKAAVQGPLSWLAKFLGRLHAYVKFRGWSDVAPRVQRQRRTRCRGKLVVLQREPRRKRATLAKFSRTHTAAKTGFWCCWRCPFLHRATCKRAWGSRCHGIVQSRSGVFPEGQGWQEPKRRTLTGGDNLACGVAGRTWSRRVGDESRMGLVRCGF